MRLLDETDTEDAMEERMNDALRRPLTAYETASTPLLLEITEGGELVSPIKPTYAQSSGDPYEEGMERYKRREDGLW